MSIRLLAKYRYYFSAVMFSRCFASVYRSVCSNLSCLTPKRYHLLANPSFSSTPSISRTNLMREVSSTLSLSLFLLYLFYQLFGNFLFIIALMFAVLAGLYALQDALLFQPNEPDTSRLIVQTPDLYQMPFETIHIETSDHERLHGFLIKQSQRSEACETLIFFHGNAGNIGHRVQNAYLLYRHCHINILLFDYRGYGKSTGVPSEAGLYLDAEAVYDYARRRPDINQQKIFLFGRSLGGAVAVHLAAQLSQTDASPPLLCLLLENTFTSIPDMAKRLFHVFLFDYIPHWVYKNLFLTMSKIRHVQVPVLFLSGEQDELVPLEMMQNLHVECQSSKKHLALFPDGQHNTTWLCNNYADRIRQYLNECSNPTDRS